MDRNVAAARAAGWQAIRFDDAGQCAEALAGHGFAPRALPRP
jgi:hypothetical protein